MALKMPIHEEFYVSFLYEDYLLNQSEDFLCQVKTKKIHA